MTEFWRTHSKKATLEEMMLDSHAQDLTVQELPEILSMLPSLENCRVLELGAGIGRYTQHLLTKAQHVTAVDFMESFVERNRLNNGHHGNATFLQADVTKLDIPKNSVDFIFSNWLLMYLSDEELQRLSEKMLESCNHRSGDTMRKFNPTCYRTEAQYTQLITSAQAKDQEGAQTFGFDVVLKKQVQTYIKMKNNPNQICWLLEKAQRPLGGTNHFQTFQQFLDYQQYTRNGILRYEKMFGAGYVSTGGASTTKEFVDLLNLKPGQKVLDVGCGIGGGDFYMAKKYGVEVLGLDLSENMVEIAIERAAKENLPSVWFYRDTILHIDDKLALFKRFYSWLKPGGQLLISDYCCGEKPWSPQFEAYVKQRGYILHTPAEYGKIIEKAGFTEVHTEDRTSQFIQVIEAELQKAENIKVEFIQEFSEGDYFAIVNGWKDKLQRSNSGDQRWGLFIAKRK
uniref:phosphoethanolamine N-methyltransferase n=1 Tax=Neogobius melanostomus TaxID=47308 RepID=A0A8C6U7R7_9GOBI